MSPLSSEGPARNGEQNDTVLVPDSSSMETSGGEKGVTAPTESPVAARPIHGLKWAMVVSAILATCFLFALDK
jgi:hypothetical protein